MRKASKPKARGIKRSPPGEQKGFAKTAEVSDYDLSGHRVAGFEFARKTVRVNIRMPEQLLEVIRDTAEGHAIPYQRFIREALEMAVRQSVPAGKKRG